MKIVILLLFSTILSACAVNYRVDTDFDSNYSFQHKKRFAIKTPAHQSGIPQDLRHQRIESNIDNALSDRGFRATQEAEADFLVSYFFTTENKQEIISYNNFYGYHGFYHCHHCYGGGISTTHVRDYLEGTLIIDVIDPASKTIKWRGSTTTRLHHSSAEEKDQLFHEVVTAILTAFPPPERMPHSQ